MEESVVEAIRNIEVQGKQQYVTFAEERLSKCVKPVADKIHKNKPKLFRRSAPI